MPVFPSDRERDSFQGLLAGDSSMHRREFIATLAGAVGGASALGLGSTSAQAAKVRRIGVLMGRPRAILATTLPHS
jgi:hypothetical protein